MERGRVGQERPRDHQERRARRAGDAGALARRRGFAGRRSRRGRRAAARPRLRALARVLARLRRRSRPARFLPHRGIGRVLRAFRVRRDRGGMGRALDGLRRRCRLRGACAPRADRGRRAARARPARAGILARMDMVRGERACGDRGRAGALRGLRLSGPRGEPALGKTAQDAPAGKRRSCVRLVRGRHALDSGTAAALLAAACEMSEPFLRRKVQCASAGGLHRVAYLEWGERESSKTLVCVHGLTRCARDFDRLAAEMVRRGYRVVCPDVAGRGDSDWLENPMEYAVPTYVYDMLTLIARLDVESVHWVGTSLGGLIGMTIAAMRDSPITRLVLNDVGPVLTAVSLERLSSYVGKWPPLPTIEAAELFVRSTSASFGPHTDAEWRFLTEHVVRKNADGSLRMHYDPAIAVPFNAELSRKDVELWSFYDAIRCPTLLLRGEQSDLLRRDTAEQMAARGPQAKVVEIAGVGHAPTLLHDDQVAIVREFLLEP